MEVLILEILGILLMVQVVVVVHQLIFGKNQPLILLLDFLQFQVCLRSATIHHLPLHKLLGIEEVLTVVIFQLQFILLQLKRPLIPFLLRQRLVQLPNLLVQHQLEASKLMVTMHQIPMSLHHL